MRFRMLVLIAGLALAACRSGSNESPEQTSQGESAVSEPQSADSGSAQPADSPTPDPGVTMTVGPRTNIAHRGASAYAPEHTLAAYKLALEMKADFVEQDLQITKDGVLVCLHDTTLDRTTNVEDVFPGREREIEDEGRRRKGYPVSDFTLEEIKQLDAGSWFDPKFAGERVPTFQEAIDLVKGNAGIYPELKAPGYYDALGFKMEEEVAKALAANGLDTEEGRQRTPVFVQSFSPESLLRMKAITGTTYKLVQLIGGEAQAAELLSDEGLEKVAEYAQGIGPAIPLLTRDRSRVERAHELGLVLHPYTVNQRALPDLYPDLKSWMDFLLYDLSVDGVFTDNPDVFPRYGRRI